MDWTVASTARNDPAIAPMLRDIEPAIGTLYCAVRDGAHVLALHVFAPTDVLIAHRRRKVLRLAASFGDAPIREDSLVDALRCATEHMPRQGAECVCALVDANTAAVTRRDGFRSEQICELVFPAPAKRTAQTLDVSIAFRELGCAELARFDYHDLCARAHAPAVAIERNANFIWGEAEGNTFKARGCELNHPQLFGDLLSALHAEHGAAQVRFRCSTGSLLARAAQVRPHLRAQAFVHNLPAVHAGIRFDAHAGLAC